METTCKNCKFWKSEELNHGEMGYCHRSGPEVLTCDIEARFPTTRSCESCDEWEEKPGGAMAQSKPKR